TVGKRCYDASCLSFLFCEIAVSTTAILPQTTKDRHLTPFSIFLTGQQCVSYSLSDGSGGGLASNYTLSDQVLTASITPKPISFTYSVSDKPYDATLAATANGSLSGTVTGDQVFLTENAEFANDSIGNNKPVTITGVTLAGDDALNYQIPSSSASGTARIHKATPVISLGSGSVVNKELGDNPFTNNVTVSVAGGFGDVSYSSSDPDVATVHPVTGEVTIIATGSVVISVAVGGTNTSNPVIQQYSLMVRPESGAGSNLNPGSSGNQGIVSNITPQPSPPTNPQNPPVQPKNEPLVTMPGKSSGNRQPPLSIKPVIPKRDSKGRDQEVKGEPTVGGEQGRRSTKGTGFVDFTGRKSSKPGEQTSQFDDAVELDHIIVLSRFGQNSITVKPEINNKIEGSGFVQVLEFRDPVVHQGENVLIVVGRDTFVHSDGSQSVKVLAQLENGEAIPDWLSFDSQTLSFSGQTPEGEPSTLTIQLVAVDAKGNRAMTGFTLHIEK
ncbi:YDG domain-containing protein, partial [Parendozoicomonas sp. Alg238-R29]|uniref:YDG domain-containing protein n=1 Tax=Parendozoicomonas sp. Alg238-R29 TaxID=2993446 RepID=UPI00248F26E3